MSTIKLQTVVQDQHLCTKPRPKESVAYISVCAKVPVHPLQHRIMHGCIDLLDKQHQTPSELLVCLALFVQHVDHATTLEQEPTPAKQAKQLQHGHLPAKVEVLEVDVFTASMFMPCSIRSCLAAASTFWTENDVPNTRVSY